MSNNSQASQAGDEQSDGDGFSENDGSSSNDTEQVDAHSVFGECPWGHAVDVECYCTCRKCRNVRLRPIRTLEMHQNGEIRGPKRIKFSLPPEPGENVDRKCNQGLPWLSNVGYMDDRCKHTRERRYNSEGDLLPRRYFGDIKLCEESGCERRALGGPPPRYMFPPPDTRQWVCEDHIADAKAYWELPLLYEAHLVQPCLLHERLLLHTFPAGLNTCTCPNLFNRWQCRACFEDKIHTLKNHFRRRVLVLREIPPYADQEYSWRSGLADREMLSLRGYHLHWKNVRKMLASQHPCHHACGRRRLQRPSTVMDCRACGGLVIRPPPALRAPRSRTQTPGRAENRALWELDQKGNAVRVGGEEGEEGGDDVRDEVPTVGLEAHEDDDNLEHPDPRRPFEEFSEDEEAYKEDWY